MNQITDTRLPQAVLDIGKIHFTGNVVPHEWYSHLRLDSGKPDLTAIVILSEIVYWYRPQRHLSEDGTQVSLTKKFQGDLLQTNAAYYENKFGLTKDQTRKALKRLEDKGLIKRDYREMEVNGIRLVNRMFIEPVPEAILTMTHPEPTSGSTSSDSGGGEVSLSSNTLSPRGDTPLLPDQTLSPGGDTLSPRSDTNTKTTTKITTKTSTEICKKKPCTKINVDDSPLALVSETVTSPRPSTTTLSDGDVEKVKPKKAKTSPQRKKTQPFPIPEDWQPSEECLARLESHGISREFAEILVDEFVLYWGERKISRPGWDSTFFKHAKNQWERHQAKAPVSEATLNRGGVGNSKQANYDYGANHATIQRNNQPERLSAVERTEYAGLKLLAEDGDIDAQRALFEFERRRGILDGYGSNLSSQVVLEIGPTGQAQPCFSTVAPGPCWDDLGTTRAGTSSVQRLR